MRYSDIRRHLKSYSILASRSTTINHAFASAIAPSDKYDELRIVSALRKLGQEPDHDLTCVYCGKRAETWDHIHATVRNKTFSGFGDRLGNLVPCCKPCNSKKGNRSWSSHLQSLDISEVDRDRRKQLIQDYLSDHLVEDPLPVRSPEYVELDGIRIKILELFEEADRLVDKLRAGRKPEASKD